VNFHNLSARHLAVVLLCAVSPWARAQLIDEVETRRDGDDAVINVHFVTPVRYTRSVAPRANDLTQVFYELLDSRGVARLLLQSGQRRLAGGDGLPEVVITDEIDGQAAQAKRKLVVRFAGETTFKVRAGRNNRSIEIVLLGQGTAVKPALPTAAMPLAAPGRQFVVLLSSSTDPSMQLAAAVPGALQQHQIVTSRRVVEGRTLYEVSLGYFGSVQEAARAADQLKSRFPQAVVVALAAPAAVPLAPPGEGTGAAPVVGAASGPGSDAAPAASGVPALADYDAQGGHLLARARAAQTAGDSNDAIDKLNQLLNLPPNRASREALELIGQVRLKAGDAVRARSEFESFLKLYPQGPDSERVRAQLAALPAQPKVADKPVGKAAATTTTSGSVGLTYYGGKSQVRTQDFQDSGLGGLPVLLSDNTLSATDQKQLVTSTDLNWRQRDADQDLRFVLRDNYTADLLAGHPNSNRLSALYVDYKSMLRGTSVRLGRQSPLGGGVLGRFDGVSAGYSFAPKWKANLVAGVPTDKINSSSKRRFWGSSIDAEALTQHLSGSLYMVQQSIDSVVDRRAIGSDLRYFNGGLAVTGTLDYDLVMKGLNIATVQGNWQLADTSSWNFLYDKRSQPLLSLGNALFFAGPNGAPPPGSVAELLASYEARGGLAQIRKDVLAVTARSTQAQLGYTTPISKNWQTGANMQLTNVGRIDPVPILLPDGQAATGNQLSLGGQLIGSNLYSARDTHVFNLSYLTAAAFKGYLAMYNNMSALSEQWQLEPSMQIYTQSGSDGLKLKRLKPGLRVTYRMAQQIALESSFDYEISRQSGVTRSENSTRIFYYFGGRYDF
jgi:tetratricopeptide (TPR) repeat protein